MIHQDPLKTATLADAEKYIYIAQCPCGHKQEVDLVKLRDVLGSDFKIRNIRVRLKCQCGRKDSIISFNCRDCGFVQ